MRVWNEMTDPDAKANTVERKEDAARCEEPLQGRGTGGNPVPQWRGDGETIGEWVVRRAWMLAVAEMGRGVLGTPGTGVADDASAVRLVNLQ